MWEMPYMGSFNLRKIKKASHVEWTILYRLQKETLGLVKYAPKKCAQKSSCNTYLSIYISHKNYMKCSLQILKNKNLSERHKRPSPNVLNIIYFWTFAHFWVGYR